MADDLSNAFGATRRDAVREARADNSRNPSSGARAGAGNAPNGAGTPATFKLPDGTTLHPFALDADELAPDGEEGAAYLW